jgi:hypothetical protein
MYLWALLGHDPLNDVVVVSGASRDLASAMRAAEQALSDPSGFIVVIEEVRVCVNATGLQEYYAPTGRSWTGRRTTQGHVWWDFKLKQQDTETLYQVPEHAYRDSLTHAPGGDPEAPARM